MTAYEPIDIGGREVAEIDALLRTLRNLRHWSIATAARHTHRDDQGRRLYTTAAGLRNEAWVDSLRAAYGLFEIEAIHDSWIEAGGSRD